MLLVSTSASPWRRAPSSRGFFLASTGGLGGLGGFGGLSAFGGFCWVVSGLRSFRCSNGGPQCDGASSGVFGGCGVVFVFGGRICCCASAAPAIRQPTPARATILLHGVIVNASWRCGWCGPHPTPAAAS